MISATTPSIAADYIQQQKPNFTPQVGLILGSGLGELADQITTATDIPYTEIPGFPTSHVKGHASRLVLGKLGNMPIACMQGRVHGYEGAKEDAFKIFIRTLKLLGCHTLIITNASGSLRANVNPGQLMLITDHINLQHTNPLIGPNDENFGSRFFPMDNAYDVTLRKRFHQIAKMSEILLAEGVYVGVTGPSFETPAEIRAFRSLGGDAVGMSTIPEVIIARHCGLRVAAIAAITNLAAGMSEEELSHEHTLHFAHIAAKNMSKLIINALESLYHDPC